MPGSIHLGKALGIDIFVHVSWFLAVILFTWSLASGWLPQSFPGWEASTYWLVAAISVLLWFLCILGHELAHALVARTYRLTVRQITLFIFGGVASIEEENRRPGVEFQVTVAGPLTSLVLAGLALVLNLPFMGSGTPTEAVLDYLILGNLGVAIFNMLPGFPLDGGRILRSILWKSTGNFQKATNIASLVGQGCAYLFIAAGIALVFTGNLFDGLWLAFIGWFLHSAAQATKMQALIQSSLTSMRVKQVMDAHPVTVPGNISLQKLVEQYIIPQGLYSALVAQGTMFTGMITLTDIGRIEREQWAQIPVGYVMRLPEQLYIAAPEQSLQEVLTVMIERDLHQVPVVQEGALVGLVSRESILQQLQLRQEVRTPQLHSAA